MAMMTDPQRATVVVFGASDAPPDTLEYRQAYELGKALACAGYNIGNGGYGGTMAATAHAARENGGLSIGVTCQAFRRAAPNPWVDREIETETLTQRLTTLIDIGQAYVALPGRTGTLLEIAMVWELINKRMMPQRPMIMLGDFWKPVIDTLVTRGQAEADFMHIAQTVAEVVPTIKRYSVNLNG